MRSSVPAYSASDFSVDAFAVVPGECVHVAADRLLEHLADPLPDLELAPAHELSQDARDHGVEALRARVTVVARPR